eukprot:UN06935
MWDFAQFAWANLKVSLATLDRLTFEQRKDMVLVSRQLTYAIGEDLCYGKWDEGSYTEGKPAGGYNCNGDCHGPSWWENTTQLFEIHTDRGKKVQYCQCWVFAAVLNTVARGLGIPSRIVTNFQSAHDTDQNRGIENFYILDVDTDMFLPSDELDHGDSVWNFHVWNEVWFTRDDIDDASGWQVVDATPQEASPGGNPAVGDGWAYQLGPASKELIHQNIDNNYDNEFVISEVNANVHFWIRDSDKTDYYLWDKLLFNHWEHYETIGLYTSTKQMGDISQRCLDTSLWDCETDREDVTDEYKVQEPSDPGVPTDSNKLVEKNDPWYGGGWRRRMRIHGPHKDGKISDSSLLKDKDNFVHIELNIPKGRILVDEHSHYSTLPMTLVVDNNLDYHTEVNYNLSIFLSTSYTEENRQLIKTFSTIGGESFDGAKRSVTNCGIHS